MDPQSSRKIQNPLACLALLYFLFFSSFKVTEEENNQFSKVPFNLIIQHQQKRVQETPPKSKPKTHQRPKKKGGSGEESGGGGRRWELGGYRLWAQVPGGYFHALKSTVRYIPALVVTHTHALADTHTFSLHAKAGTPQSQTHTNTRAHTNQCNENCQ